jgi:hypothetical protein
MLNSKVLKEGDTYIPSKMNMTIYEQAVMIVRTERESATHPQIRKERHRKYN